LVGYGVFTLRDFERGEFLLEYAGTLKEPHEADALFDQTYVYYFMLGNKQYRSFANVYACWCNIFHDIIL